LRKFEQKILKYLPFERFSKNKKLIKAYDEYEVSELELQLLSRLSSAREYLLSDSSPNILSEKIKGLSDYEIRQLANNNKFRNKWNYLLVKAKLGDSFAEDFLIKNFMLISNTSLKEEEQSFCLNNSFRRKERIGKFLSYIASDKAKIALAKAFDSDVYEECDTYNISFVYPLLRNFKYMYPDEPIFTILSLRDSRNSNQEALKEYQKKVQQWFMKNYDVKIWTKKAWIIKSNNGTPQMGLDF